MFDEIRFIELLMARLLPASRDVLLGVGDDAALLLSGSDLVATTDMVLDGVDFRLSQCGPEAAARKAVKKNLSDLAAMGARPVAFLCCACLPDGIDEEWAASLIDGLVDEGRRHGCDLVGGDTKRSPSGLSLAVSALGRMDGLPPMRRDGARIGDALWVTGALGGAGGGRHLSFDPRVDSGIALARSGRVRAAIDLSDGLSIDLRRLCAKSEVGARLDARTIPIHPDAHTASRADGRPPLDHALHDGEDYELLFCADPDFRPESIPEVAGIGVSRIGVVVERTKGVRLAFDDREEDLPALGFRHVFSEDPS